MYCSKDITLLMTVYNINANEMAYWGKRYSELKSNGSTFHILLDNPSIKKSDIWWADENDIYTVKQNYGKLSRVYKHIKDDNVKTEYFKTIDPDDWIYLKKFFEIKIADPTSIILLNKLWVEEVDFNNTYKRKEKKVVRNYKRYKLDSNFHISQNYLDFISGKVDFNSSTTILPTSTIFVDKIFEKDYKNVNITFAEDQILGLISWHNGGKIKLLENSNFYIYNKMAGWSNNSFAKNNQIVLSQLDKGFKIWRDYFAINKSFPNTVWPFWECDNLLKNSEYNKNAMKIKEDIKKFYENKLYND